MIIEASQINSNGGIVLLELLLRHLSCCNTKVLVYIAYEAVYERLKKYQSDSIILQRTSPWATFSDICGSGIRCCIFVIYLLL